MLPFRLDEEDDSLIRARDGYWLFLEFTPGDRMPCPTCGATLHVPHCKTAEVACQPCKQHGRDGRHWASYWPLGEVLIDYIKKCNPERGGISVIKAECDAENHTRLAQAERDFQNYNEAIWSEAHPQVVGIPQVGYTGRADRFIHTNWDYR